MSTRKRGGVESRTPTKPKSTDADFEIWYRQYPKRVAKAAALTAYRAVITKKLATPEELLAGAMRYAAERGGQDPRYSQTPFDLVARWLLGRRTGSDRHHPRRPAQLSAHRHSGADRPPTPGEAGRRQCPLTSARFTGQDVATGTPTAVVDRFAQVFAVAKPTLDAALKLREARTWLTDRQRFPRIMIDLDRVDDADEVEAKAKLALIPEIPVLQEAAQLFDDAVRKAAPEPWYHLVLGTMLAAMPNAKNVAPDYQFGIVDMLLHDEESWEKGCEPGFSAPVFVQAIRQVRREEEFVPTAAKILKACKEQRQRFRQLASEVEILIKVRENAKMIQFDEEQYRADFGDC